MDKIILIFFCILLITGCKKEETSFSENKDDDTVIKKQPVHVEPVKRNKISSYLISSGTIQARKSVDIFPKISGYVTEVLAKNGDFVKKQRTLVQMEQQEWQIAVTQAEMEILELEQRKKQELLNTNTLNKKIKQAQLSITELSEQMKQIKLDQEKTKKDLTRSMESYQKNIVSEGELETNRYNHQKSILAENSLNVQIQRAVVTKEEAILDLERAKIELQNLQIGIERSQQATLKDAKLKLSYATITAPFDGTLLDKTVVEGQLISTANKVFTLVDLTELMLVLNIPEKELLLLKKNQQVLLRSENFPNLLAKGKITAISPIVNQETGTVNVDVSIQQEKDSILRPGVFVQASIVTEEKESVVTIPRAPIVYESGKAYVFVVSEKNRAQKKVIETGIREGDIIEVISGVEEGEKLIISGHHVVEDKEEVEIVEIEKELENN